MTCYALPCITMHKITVSLIFVLFCFVSFYASINLFFIDNVMKYPYTIYTHTKNNNNKRYETHNTCHCEEAVCSMSVQSINKHMRRTITSSKVLNMCVSVPKCVQKSHGLNVMPLNYQNIRRKTKKNTQLM